MFLVEHEKTSNDIIAGNGKILSVHKYCVVLLVKKLYYDYKFFSFSLQCIILLC